MTLLLYVSIYCVFVLLLTLGHFIFEVYRQQIIISCLDLLYHAAFIRFDLEQINNENKWNKIKKSSTICYVVLHRCCCLWYIVFEQGQSWKSACQRDFPILLSLGSVLSLFACATSRKKNDFLYKGGWEGHKNKNKTRLGEFCSFENLTSSKEHQGCLSALECHEMRFEFLWADSAAVKFLSLSFYFYFSAVMHLCALLFRCFQSWNNAAAHLDS